MGIVCDIKICCDTLYRCKRVTKSTEKYWGNSNRIQNRRENDVSHLTLRVFLSLLWGSVFWLWYGIHKSKHGSLI